MLHMVVEVRDWGFRWAGSRSDTLSHSFSDQECILFIRIGHNLDWDSTGAPDHVACLVIGSD